MEKKLQKIIRENKVKFLNHEENEKYDVFTTLCLLVPSDDVGNSFSLQLMCGAGNFENDETDPLTLYEESIPFTVEDFKRFMTNCSKKYYRQFEILIPPICEFFYGIVHEPTLDDVVEIIEEFVSDEDWSLCEGIGLGFRITDRTM